MGIPATAGVSDFSHVDLVVCVKRISSALQTFLHSRRKPWVWDIVDAWPQKDVAEMQEGEAISWLRSTIANLQPNAIVFPTTRMQQDSGWTGPSLVLPHHAWTKYQPKTTNRSVYTVGYEGSPKYIKAWKPVIDAQCLRRGWVFSVNDELSNADIGICLRDNADYPARHWKSNCKLANLQALAIPAICSPEQGYIEFGTGWERMVNNQQELSEAFDYLSNYDLRCRIAEYSVMAVPRLEDVARTYKTWLERLSF